MKILLFVNYFILFYILRFKFDTHIKELELLKRINE